jgi:hypothetical protein
MERYDTMVDKMLNIIGEDIEFYEKDIWHKEMCNANLYPLIRAIRSKNTVIIGNKMLRGLTFLKYSKFIEVDYPNCFDDLNRVANEILYYNQPGVYVFACGIPATLFVQAVHGKIENSWFIDMGSIWDGFVGIGGQRPTRRELYKNPGIWKEWRDKNLQEINWEQKEMPLVEWHGMGSKEIYDRR